MTKFTNKYRLIPEKKLIPESGVQFNFHDSNSIITYFPCAWKSNNHTRYTLGWIDFQLFYEIVSVLVAKVVYPFELKSITSMIIALPCTRKRSYYTITIMKIELHTRFWEKKNSGINRYLFVNFVTNRKIYWNENQDIRDLD